MCLKSALVCGFQKKTLTCQRNVNCVLCVRNPVTGLREQVSQRLPAEISYHNTMRVSYLYSVHADMGRRRGTAVKQSIKTCNDLPVSCKKLENDGVISSVRRLQLFGDKSHVLLFVNAHHFNALHATLVNFTEKLIRAFITTVKTIVAYPPVNCQTKHAETLCSAYSQVESARSSRSVILTALHECIEHCLKPLHDLATQAFPVSKEDGQKNLLHFILFSHIAYIPESEELCM